MLAHIIYIVILCIACTYSIACCAMTYLRLNNYGLTAAWGPNCQWLDSSCTVRKYDPIYHEVPVSGGDVVTLLTGEGHTCREVQQRDSEGSVCWHVTRACVH